MARTRLVCLLLLALPIALGGCFRLFDFGPDFQSKTVLTIRTDGSGTLVHTAYYDKNYSEKEFLHTVCTQSAKEVGEGVTLKYAVVLNDKPGWNGAKAVYEFKDIWKLSVGIVP